MNTVRRSGRTQSRLGKFARFLLLMAFCFGTSRLQRVRAQVAAPLPIEAALRVKQFAILLPLAFSPDGKWLACTVQNTWSAQSVELGSYLRSGVPPWGSGTHIEIINVATGQQENLTKNGSDSWLPVWSPDGRYLAFLSDREGGQAQLWSWDRESFQFRRISPIPVRANQIEWTPDSRSLVVTTAPVGDFPKSTTAHSAIKTNSGSPLVYKTSAAHGEPAAASAAWDLDVYRRNLTVVNRGDGRVTTLVQGEKIASYSIAPGGSAIAYTVAERFERPGSQQILFDLQVETLPGRKDRMVAADVRMEYDGQAFSWSPDGSQLSFRTGGMDVKASDCYVWDLRSGTLHSVTNLSSPTGTDAGLAKPLWDKQDRIYFLHNGALWESGRGQAKSSEIGAVPNRRIVALIPWRGNQLWTSSGGTSTVVVTHDDSRKQDGFYRINLRTRESEKLLEAGQCYTCADLMPPFTVSTDGKYLAYVAEDAGHDADLRISTADFVVPRRLTRLNPQFDYYQLGKAQLVRWLGDDGDCLDGALLLPGNYRQGVRYPLIVWVYGGSFLSNDLDHFGLAGTGPFNMQLLATRGYAVLLPDAPQRAGTPLADLAKTVLPGVNKIIKMGIADPARLGLAGHSYGGYSVLSLIVQTRRFKAAVEMDGFADLVGAYGEMTREGSAFGVALNERGQGLMGGAPWQSPERYVENSPLFHFNRVDTPLLIVQGSDDATVAPFLGDEIFVGLRRLGKDAQYLKYEDEGHSPLQWSFADQGDLLRRVIFWFNTHLGKPSAK